MRGWEIKSKKEERESGSQRGEGKRWVERAKRENATKRSERDNCKINERKRQVKKEIK